jgi:arylsulfatase A-like enzyme
LAAGLFGLAAIQALAAAPEAANSRQTPNILFIILDDVGIDQLRAFNPNTPKGVDTPVLDTLAKKGVAFSNCWAMPECSPSRSSFFTGRYPLRTGVRSAILSYCLPSAQVSPYEITTPKVLAQAGYQSAMVGKFHIAGPDNNPDGFQTPARLGWDYFNGNLQGGPPFIDTTLGGQTSDHTLYPSGFPLGSTRGVCWFQGPQGVIYRDDKNGAGYTGQECVLAGGIPALTSSGAFARMLSEATIEPDFSKFNGYYVWPRVVNQGGSFSRSISREYMTTAHTNDALQWIRSKSPRMGRGRPIQRMVKPWMCTVSYNAIHTPYQIPPPSLHPPGFVWPKEIPVGNTTAAQIKIVSDLTLYAMDQEIGRLLVGAGLARRLPNGRIDYQPNASNTMVVVVGDNGTYFSSVKAPYNPLRAKASAYQTGVSVPLIVSGPLVRQPGRVVDHLVNAVDLFALFGEIARLNVRDVVPQSRVLDCEPMLPYLVNPQQQAIRKYNYTELGATVPPGVKIWPSVFKIGGAFVGNDFLFDSQELCEEAGGEWFGPGAPEVYDSSCEVRDNVYPGLIIQPREVWAVRNKNYKLVKSFRASCDSSVEPYEFFDLRPGPFKLPALDNSPNDLLQGPLNAEQDANFEELKGVLDGILRSHSPCPGDGNLDRVVDEKDLAGVHEFWGKPSVFDFNSDGTTDGLDEEIVLQNLGMQCGPG